MALATHWEILAALSALMSASAAVLLVLIASQQIDMLRDDAGKRDSTVRDEARRQNTLTFLLETESDREILEGYKAYSELFNARVKTLTPRHIVDPASADLTSKQIDAESDKEAKDRLSKARADYRRILRILNVMELGAVGIKNKILDERVLSDWWADFYVASFCRMMPVIAAIRIINSGMEDLQEGSPAPMDADALYAGAQEQARRWRNSLEAAHPEKAVYTRYRRYFEQDLSWWRKRMDTPLAEIYKDLQG